MAKPVLFVVDNDENSLQQMQRDLQHKYGKKYRVLSASSGREAVKKQRQLRDSNEQLAMQHSEGSVAQGFNLRD